MSPPFLGNLFSDDDMVIDGYFMERGGVRCEGNPRIPPVSNPFRGFFD